MFLKAKILRSFYKKLKQGDIAPFARGILLKMKDNTTYANLQDILNVLQAAVNTLENAMAAAENKGRQEVADKNLAIAAVFEILDELSDGIEFFGKKDLPYFIGTGMPLQTRQTNHSVAEINIPIDFTAQSDGQPGGVLINFNIVPHQKSLFKMAGLEWSTDLKVWSNGDYSTRRKFRVSNKPSNEKIYVRIKIIGTDGRTSKWTEPVLTSVL